MSGFNDEQQSYLQGFVLGSDVARAVRSLPVLARSRAVQDDVITLGPKPPSDRLRPDLEAQDAALAAGHVLCAEEKAKRDKDPLSMWDDIRSNAQKGTFPQATDVLLYKFSGLFYVAPAQNSYMCRLRFPGGEVKSYQLRGLADLSDRYASGHVDVTTRANLQLRGVRAEHAPDLLSELCELGIVIRGSGADNIRNITAGATSGFDPQELIETLPLAREMHHYILNHRDMYCLPRKFNIAFDGGGRVATLEETNDIGFQAVRMRTSTEPASMDVRFRLTLGGITGHQDFARDTGVLLRPEECIPVAAAAVRVFLKHGDRTNRRRARLKYLLDEWGFDRFIAEVERQLGHPLARAAVDEWQTPEPPDRWAHVGIQQQKQDGRCYVGVVLPVGRMTTTQLRGLVRIADRYGSGAVRLTVWQNLLIPDVRAEDLDVVTRELEAIDLDWKASSVRAGLVACTGKAGCKYAAADTKRHALQLANHIEQRLDLDVPVNVHVTGCHHSCAQHYIGDIGLQSTQVEVGDDVVEGYHLSVGGGFADQQAIGRTLFHSLPFAEVPATVERLLGFYLDQRFGPSESFADFTRRFELDELRDAIMGYALV